MKEHFEEKIEKVLDYCRELNDEGGQNQYWILSDEAGRFINQKAKEVNAKYILEIGTSIGYSTIFLAEAVRENTGGDVAKGKVYAMESHGPRAAIARANFVNSGLSEFITLVQSHAPEHIPFVDPNTGEALTGKIDILFLDCIKKYYLPCLEATLPLLHLGSLIIADNVISHADQMTDFLNYIKTNSDLESEIFNIGTGVLVAKTLRMTM
ncbi:MAG: class I SAM-dependent methyltransferase [Candidatus Peregrinibacteria bacterium]|nr:class I SAM-dependent methyltransferase [Candidatus Peregrinibacteria bacterium]MDZ4245125.1 class I SAM-dependent methyltransferase [Candidatus Gracilibacteria bacterium]